MARRSGAGALFLPRPFCAETCDDAPEACGAARRLTADDTCSGRSRARASRWPTSRARWTGCGTTSSTCSAHAARRPWPSRRCCARSPATARTGSRAGAAARTRGRSPRPRGPRRPPAGRPAGQARRPGRRDRARGLPRHDATPAPPALRARTRSASTCAARTRRCACTAPRWPTSSPAGATTARGSRPTRHDAANGDGASGRWDVCQDAAFEVIEFPDPDAAEPVNAELSAAARRVCMCFEQQMLAADRRKVPRTARKVLARVLGEAGL